MLAGRLAGVVRNVLEEYHRFAIFDHLNAASLLSAQRADLTGLEYERRAEPLRAWAHSVLENSNVMQYPEDMRRLLRASKYSTALPEYLAKLIQNGFPSDKNMAISSSELGMYIQLANSLTSDFNFYESTSKKLNIEDISIPEGKISSDIVIPRRFFDNRADRFMVCLSRFVNIMSYLGELTTGSENSPLITYTSTTDPLTGLATYAIAAWGFIKFYKLALEIADKQLSLLKTIKELRSSSLTSPKDLEEQIKARISELLDEAVEKTIASVPSKVPHERLNELRIALNKDSKFVIEAIANGARVGVTVDSINRLALITDELPEITRELVDEQLKSQIVWEIRLGEALISLGEPPAALLTVETSSEKKELG